MHWPHSVTFGFIHCQLQCQRERNKYLPCIRLQDVWELNFNFCMEEAFLINGLIYL